MKKITIEPTKKLRAALKKEAGRSAKRPRVLAKDILEEALKSPHSFLSPLEKDWDGEEDREMVIEIGEASKSALKGLAKKRGLALKDICIYMIKRHLELKKKPGS